MNEIEIIVDGKVYRLNNNSNKYDRAKKDAGPNAARKQILAHYDKLLGYIQDEHGNKIENGLFWKEENNKLETKKVRKENLAIFSEVTRHPVIASLIVIIIFAVLWYLFGIDLRSFN